MLDATLESMLFAGGDDGMDALRMSSITYRIATGKNAGRKVITLKTLPGDAGL